MKLTDKIKKIFMLIIILFVLIFRTYGQNYELILTHKKTNSEITIEEGEKIKIYTLTGSIINSELAIVNDSLIAIGADTLSLKEIEKIKIKTDVSLIIGQTLLGLGSFCMVGGSIMFAQIYSDDFYMLKAILGLIIGVPLIGTGIILTTSGILLLTIKDSYKKEKWYYKISLISN